MDASTELVLLGQKTWNDDGIKKRCLVQNAQNIGMVDTVFEELVSEKSFKVPPEMWTTIPVEEKK
jgi:hypothetical protein